MSNGFSLEIYYQLVAQAQALRGAEPLDKDPLADLFCTVHPEANEALEAFVSHPSSTPAERIGRGRSLESLTALAVAGLQGLRELKSFFSASAQYDLLAAGSSLDPAWLAVREFLELPPGRNDLLVEVKATEGPVDTPQVLRLGALIDAHFANTVGLGILVCPRGATGHPKPGRRALSLRMARLQQVLYSVRTKTPIVVLDGEDIEHFVRTGGLLRRLSFRIRELAQLHGLQAPEVVGTVEVDVPNHMRLAATWVGQRGM
jgi:hypothetical protein